MDTLYHYCPTSSFEAIISRRSIRLSSLSLSNDTMEGRLVSHTFEKLMSQSGMGPEESEFIRETVKFVEETFDGLGFCMSEQPDILSQWRGYADDGQGFSIGFSKAYLEELARSANSHESSFHLERVLYKPSEHEAALKPTYDEIKRRIDSGELKKLEFAGLLSLLSEEETKKLNAEHLKSKINLGLPLLGAFPKVHILKNIAFSEELEWRLITYFDKASDKKALFRATRDRLIPYREFKLESMSQNSIVAIYVGPKNITPDFVIERFLSLNGFSNVEIHHSAASYR